MKKLNFRVNMNLGLCLVLLVTINSCKKGNLALTEKEIKAKLSSTAVSANLKAGTGPTEFTLVVMPDTQHYMAGFFGGNYAMFTAMINWIKANKADIAYVAGVGDVVEHGDNSGFAANEWTEAAQNGYHRLESDGIPYGLAVGNHDQGQEPTAYEDWGDAANSSTDQFNASSHFGIGHFNNTAHPYWKGNYGLNNDCHYDFFSAGGLDFMVIYIEYDNYNGAGVRAGMNQWARDLCIANPGRKAIVVTHYMMQIGEQYTSVEGVAQGAFSGQGQGIYNALRDLPNVFMFLGGHVYGTEPAYSGEGYREDTYNGHTIRTYLSNYQNRPGGGYGRMRLMKFSIENDEVSVKTFTPVTGSGAPAAYETDVNSQFTKPLFGAAPVYQVPNGKYKILAKHSGQALVVKDAALTDTARVVQWTYADNGVHNDQWTLTQLTSSGTGYYKITNVHSGKEMVVAGISTAYGSGNVGIIAQWGPFNAAPPFNDEWALFPVGNGYYKIVARHSGLCLNVAGGDNTLGAQVKQWKYLGTDGVDNDQFQLVPIP